jgi:hypothetical protein
MSAMGQSTPGKCFVIMPFGNKSIRDGSGRAYDFDKIYRIIMRRAIKLAGLEPIRADERKGSNIIHTDMFKDLRDQSVVLADLSLENPNVYYELGIRHVMSPRGTVLMCRAGSDVPFDVKLSRVIFYHYDGASLDWEEAERVIQELQFALEEAKRGVPDSPVHALLERVLRDAEPSSLMAGTSGLGSSARGEILDEFQRLVAEHWANNGESITDLHARFRTSQFGARALGHLCLKGEIESAMGARVARALYYAEQYDLANRVFAKLADSGGLEIQDVLRYASSITEEDQSLAAVRRALAQIRRARDRAERDANEKPEDTGALLDLATCDYSLAGMLTWQWLLTGSEDDLRIAIEALDSAIDSGNDALSQHTSYPIGRLAQTHLKMLLMLRVKDQNRERPDGERHREAILTMKARGDQSPQAISYLRWYQAITMADAGDSDGSRRMALVAFSEDAKLMHEEGNSDVGRRQYMLLRRFLEHNAHVLRNPSLVGHISQILQIGH